MWKAGDLVAVRAGAWLYGLGQAGRRAEPGELLLVVNKHGLVLKGLVREGMRGVLASEVWVVA